MDEPFHATVAIAVPSCFGTSRGAPLSVLESQKCVNDPDPHTRERETSHLMLEREEARRRKGEGEGAHIISMPRALLRLLPPAPISP